MNKKTLLAILLIVGITFSQTYPVIIANPDTLECKILRNPEQKPDGFTIIGSVTTFGTIENGCDQWLCDQTRGVWNQECNCPEGLVFTDQGCIDIDEEQLCKETRGIWAADMCTCIEGNWSNNGCVYENGEKVPEFEESSILIPAWTGIILLLVIFIFRKRLLKAIRYE